LINDNERGGGGGGCGGFVISVLSSLFGATARGECAGVGVNSRRYLITRNNRICRVNDDVARAVFPIFLSYGAVS